jgi:hypothetical protein
LAKAQQTESLFPNLEQVLYQDAAHAYDDSKVILLSEKQIPVLRSHLLPVRRGDVLKIETHVHYTKNKTKTWQKIGAGAAGLAIGSLPYLLDRRQSGEETSSRGLLGKAAPLAGVGVATLPFAINTKGKRKQIGRSITAPTQRNGWLVPNAYLRYHFYNTKGQLIYRREQLIDRQAKDAWQSLALVEPVTEDGYMQIEVGNSSRQPVWMDGITLRRRHNDTGRESHLSAFADVPFSGDLPDTTSTDKPTGTSLPDSIVANSGGNCPNWEVGCEIDLGDLFPSGDNYCYGTNNPVIKSGSGTAGDPFVVGCATYELDGVEVSTPNFPENAPFPGDNSFEYGYYDDSRVTGSKGGNKSGGGNGNQPQPINEGEDQYSPNLRSRPKLITNECEALRELYNTSFNADGSVWRENSAWITERGIILLPNEANSSRHSNNSHLDVRSANGGYEVEYPKGSGQWTKILAHVHTHPNTDYGDYRDARPGGVYNSSTSPDWEFAKKFPGLTNFITSTSSVYRYVFSPNSNSRYVQQNIGVSTSFLSCTKLVSNYYY